MSNSRGMHKVEFYMALDEIKELYSKGYVVFKILYEEMKKRHNWSMSYWSFCKYAKKELAEDSKKKTLLNDENILQESNNSTPKKKKGPIITRTENKHFYKTAKDDIPEDRRL